MYDVGRDGTEYRVHDARHRNGLYRLPPGDPAPNSRFFVAVDGPARAGASGGRSPRATPLAAPCRQFYASLPSPRGKRPPEWRRVGRAAAALRAKFTPADAEPSLVRHPT